MRYEITEDIIFTNINGIDRTLKDMREYENQNAIAFVNVNGNQFVDEIATRPEFYGDGSEFEIYKIVDQNIIKIFDVGFDLNKVKKLEIPQ